MILLIGNFECSHNLAQRCMSGAYKVFDNMPLRKLNSGVAIEGANGASFAVFFAIA